MAEICSRPIWSVPLLGTGSDCLLSRILLHPCVPRGHAGLPAFLLVKGWISGDRLPLQTSWLQQQRGLLQVYTHNFQMWVHHMHPLCKNYYSGLQGIEIVPNFPESTSRSFSVISHTDPLSLLTGPTPTLYSLT